MLELCLIIIVVIGIHAERMLHNGSIKGIVSLSKISPYNTSSPSILAVRGNDSISVSNNEGHFGVELQPGEWKLIFASRAFNSIPLVKKIQVQEGQKIDLGEIRLEQ